VKRGSGEPSAAFLAAAVGLVSRLESLENERTRGVHSFSSSWSMYSMSRPVLGGEAVLRRFGEGVRGEEDGDRLAGSIVGGDTGFLCC